MATEISASNLTIENAATRQINAVHHRDELQLHVRPEHALFVLLIGVIFMLRVTNINYNTFFVDEAIYVNVGQGVLVGNFSQAASGWMFGSYLYPSMVAIANNLGGVVAVRLLGAFLSMLAAIMVYHTTRRVFNNKAALWALFIFGVTGQCISLAQQAVYDTLGMPLLAVAVYFMVVGVQSTGKATKYNFILSGVAATLSILAKYIGILSMPAVGAIGVALYFYQGRSLRYQLTKVPWLYFIAPIMIIFGLYVAVYYTDLVVVFTGQFSTQVATRAAILNQIIAEIGAVIALAVIGTIFAVRKMAAQANSHRALVLIFATIFSAGLIVSMLSIPLYHWVGSNIRSMWKHEIYSVALLAPLAGFGIATIVDWARNRKGFTTGAVRLVGALATVLLFFFVVNLGLNQNWGMQHSWPDATKTIEYLRKKGVTDKSLVLAAGSAVYEYYFNFGPAKHEVWQSTWYMNYTDRNNQFLTGVDAMKAAMADCALDYAVMDDYYAPEMNAVLEPALIKAGYVIDYRETQTISSGDKISIRVYIPSASAGCVKRTKS